MSDRVGRLGLVGLAALYVALARWLPPADDELYYWCWSRDLGASYFDHPPLVAYLIRASTELFGDTLLAVRLPAVACSLVVVAAIMHLTRPRGFVAWVAVMPLFTIGAVLVTPDAPLLAFWALYLAWLVRVHRTVQRPSPDRQGGVELARPVRSGLGPTAWALGGLILGGAMLSKYTAALAVPAGLLSFVLAGRPWREWVPGYALHAAVAGLALVPVLAFNVGHDFAPLRFQWDHATARGPAGLGSFGEFVGGQVILFGWLPLALLPWVVANARELTADSRLRVSVCLYAAPLAFFVYKAARGPLEGNWALVCYVGFWPVAAHWYETVRHARPMRWLTAASFAAPAGGVAVLAAHLLTPLPFVSPGADRVGRQAARLAVAQAAADTIGRHGEPIPVYAISYQWTAWLRFRGVEAQQLDGTTRPSHFTLTPHSLADVDRAYVFAEGPLCPEFTPGFGMPEVVATFPLVVRGTPVGEYQLLLYTRGRSRVP